MQLTFSNSKIKIECNHHKVYKRASDGNCKENFVFRKTKMKKKMKTKNLLVSFLAVAMVAFLTATISAAEIASGGLEIEVNDINVSQSPALVAGQSVTIEVTFTATIDASNVRVKAELEGEKVDVDAVSETFDVEAGRTYKKSLELVVPYELKDELSSNVELSVKVWNGEHKTERSGILLRVQRPSYNIAFKSISVPQSIEAGDDLPIELVLKNIGYNNLDDLYVIVRIPALGIEKSAYFGDLVAIENCTECDKETDTATGKITISIPYETPEGVYTIEIEASNDDLVLSETKTVAIRNEFPDQIIKTAQGILFINPTSKLKMYRIVLPTGEQFVTIKAGSSELVPISANSEIYTVNVLSMKGELVASFDFGKSGAKSESANSAIIALTIALAIIFVVLLVILIVLLGKKPSKSEELSESYY